MRPWPGVKSRDRSEADVGSVLEPGKPWRFEVKWWGHAAIAKHELNDEGDVYFWTACGFVNADSGCGFAKVGDKPPYLNPSGFPVNPGLVPDHANVDKLN
jgi:hypothetical protein